MESALGCTFMLFENMLILRFGRRVTESSKLWYTFIMITEKEQEVYPQEMKKKNGHGDFRLQRFLASYPTVLVGCLLDLEKEVGQPLYLVGGTVRDVLMGREPKDLDLAIQAGATALSHKLICLLGGGVVVPLGKQEDDACRVVWKGLVIDIADFRNGAETIEEDLRMRDFTVNGMAFQLRDFLEKDKHAQLFDPVGGTRDMKSCALRACERGFVEDPLRMLRGYRLCAQLDFVMDDKTQLSVVEHQYKIKNVAKERISYELNCIMESNRAYDAIRDMAESGILFQILPELQEGVGVAQPASHHLDVFEHNLEALQCMERVLGNPETFFPGFGVSLFQYLEIDSVKRCLKWAALLHDVGKPAVCEVSEKQQGRVTFYNHDQLGKQLVMVIAKRLRWSTDECTRVAQLIEMHMHPFHLCNIQRRTKVSNRACLKLCKKAGDNLDGLFLLAMADSLASRGEKAPQSMESELSILFCTLQETIDRIIQPVLDGPRLLTGKDLIEVFHLEPGPLFSTIFEKLELARVEGEVSDRGEAFEWLGKFIQGIGQESVKEKEV